MKHSFRAEVDTDMIYSSYFFNLIFVYETLECYREIHFLRSYSFVQYAWLTRMCVYVVYVFFCGLLNKK
jgi:hypothetical protein